MPNTGLISKFFIHVLSLSGQIQRLFDTIAQKGRQIIRAAEKLQKYKLHFLNKDWMNQGLTINKQSITRTMYIQDGLQLKRAHNWYALVKTASSLRGYHVYQAVW